MARDKINAGVAERTRGGWKIRRELRAANSADVTALRWESPTGELGPILTEDEEVEVRRLRRDGVLTVRRGSAAAEPPYDLIVSSGMSPRPHRRRHPS